EEVILPTSVPNVERLLQPAFAALHVKALLKHFREMNAAFQRGAWEQAILKGGKFVEAALKALFLHVGKTLPAATKDFRVDVVINDLQYKEPAGSFDDTIRLTIPRACRLVYDIASNRGARHDPAEVDPNQMDARAVVGAAAWVLAEMLRYAQKGLDPSAVEQLVEVLTRRQYPLIEDVDGRVYFHVEGASARTVALLSLWHRYPHRMTKGELGAAIMRHHFKKRNAEV